MKAAAFQELLKSIRDAGAYLKSSREAVVRTNSVPSGFGRRQLRDYESHDRGSKSAHRR